MHDHFSARMRTTLSIVGALFMILAGFSACGSSANTAPAGNPIKIGISLSNTGDYKADGGAMEQGYKLWADTINNNGGLLGRPVVLDILHDNSTQDQVAANYEKLITVDHVDLTFGPFSSLLTKAAACTTFKHGYALLEGAGGGPSVFSLHCDKNFKPLAPGDTTGTAINNTFDVSLPVEFNLESFAYYILSLPLDMRPKTAAYATEDDPFTAPQVDHARKILEAAGIKTVYNPAPYDATKTQNFPLIAQGVIASKADIGVFGTVLPDIAAFIKTFKQNHFSLKAIVATAGPDLGPQFVQAVGGNQAAEDVFVPNGWYPQADNYQNSDMVSAYLAQYGGTADGINSDVAEAYSVGQVAAQAVTQKNTLDQKTLLNVLHNQNSVFNTAQGTVKFNAIGENTASQAYLFQWQKGSLIPVFPDDAAVANPSFPKSPW